MLDQCHCFCQKVHPYAEGVCDGQPVKIRRLQTALLGVVQVPICGPCLLVLPIPGDVESDGDAIK